MRPFLGFLLLFFLGAPAGAEWKIPQVEQKNIPEGTTGNTLFLLQDHDLPLFEARLYFKVGSLHDPKKKTGLADLAANLLVSGGTEKKSPQEVNQWLDQRSILISGSSQEEFVSFTLSCLSENRQEGLSLLSELLLQPGWDKKEFSLLREQFLEGLRRTEDHPDQVGDRKFQETLLGEENPWGRLVTPKSVQRIKLRDLKEFHQKHIGADNVVLAVAGDFSKEEIQKWFFDLIQKLPKKTEVLPQWKLENQENKMQEVRIAKKITQVFIAMGHLAPSRFDPDRTAYELMQTILGGDGILSRLGSELRTQKGLTYGITSSTATNPSHGYFKIRVQTRTEAQEEVMQSIKKHLQRIASARDITAEELKRSQEALANQFIFNFDSSFTTVFLKAGLFLKGYPEDHLETYLKRLRSVTLEDLTRVGQKWLEPEKLTTVIVGPKSK